jgi:hypothetical protein
MFDRNERQLRLEKSKIYRQMLDNQILLNEQYRKKQKEEDTDSHARKRTSPRTKKSQSS